MKGRVHHYIDNSLLLIPIFTIGFLSFLCGDVSASDSNPVPSAISPACDLVVTVPTDIHLCDGDDFDLCGTIATTYDDVELEWSENGSSTNYDLCENIDIEENTTFTLTVTATSEDNLITNGDFENGDDGSFTTIYLDAIANCTSHSSGYLGCEGVYAVIDDPSDGHTNFDPCGDHTSGSGNMMVVNGASSLLEIWCQEVCVDPEASYLFSAWAASVNPGSPAELQFSIDGNLIGNVFDLTSTTCSWEQFEADWEADGETLIEICVTNQNTAAGGNDFALDDIEFFQVCKEEQSFEVTISDMELDIDDVDPLNCSIDEIEVYLDIFPNQPYNDIEWDTWDGDILDDNGESIIVGAAGLYEVTVTDIHGCTYTSDVEVESEIYYPSLQIDGDDLLDCINTSVILTAITDAHDPEYIWEDEDGNIIGTMQQITISDPGEIDLTVIDGDNACDNFEDIEIEIDTVTTQFDLMKSNDLNCNQSVAQVNTTEVLANVSWTTSSGQIIQETNDTILVSQADTLYAAFTNDNGCIHLDTISVLETIPYFDYTAIDNDHINCNQPLSDVNIDFDTNLFNIIWTGNASPFGTNNNVQITSAGTYTYEIYDSNGCSQADSIIVTENFREPSVFAASSLITCTLPESEIGIFWNTNDILVSEVLWTLPDGSSYMGGITTTTSQPGWVYYTAFAIGNGCTSSDSIQVMASTDFPDVAIEGGDINCTQATVDLINTGSTQNVTYLWTLPDGVTTNSETITTDLGGIHTLVVSDNNGCESTAMFNVSIDTDLPIIELEETSVLDCNNTFVTPDVDILSPYASVLWEGTGFTSGDLNFTTSTPGDYFLTVTGENGCTAEGNLSVSIDTIPDAFSFDPPELLSCNNPFFLPSIPMPPNDSRTFSWETPSGEFIDHGDLTISEPGTYFLTMVGDNGCSDTVPYEVEQDIDLPMFSSNATALTCDINTTQISSSATGVNLDYSYFDAVTNEMLGTGENITLDGSKPIRVVATDENGCTSFQDLIITYDTIPPMFTPFSDQLGCQVSGVNVFVDSNDPISDYQIYDTSLQLLGGADHLITEPGSYIVIAESENGCVSQETLSISTDTSTVVFSLQSGILDCNQSLAPIDIITNDDYSSAVLINSSGDILEEVDGTSDFAGAPLPGTYQVIITGTNGCSSESTVDVIENIQLIDFRLEGEVLTCEKRSATISILTQETYTEATIQNITTNGAISELGIMSQVEVMELGTYEVFLTGLNGCISSQTIEIVESIQMPTLNEISAETISCDGSGLVENFDIAGGTPPYTIFLDGAELEQTGGPYMLSGLGDHIVSVIDANGCISDKIFTLDPIPAVEAYITPEVTVVETEDRELMLELNKPDEEIGVINWMPSVDLSCDDCLNPTFLGDTSMTYTIYVEDIYGCNTLVEVRINIEIPEIIRIYIPNVIDVSSMENQFSIFSGEDDIEVVESLHIYDRWGNLVFLNENFLSNDPSEGWDGRYNNVDVIPGVYVYVFDILYTNGEREILGGDVTVIR